MQYGSWVPPFYMNLPRCCGVMQFGRRVPPFCMNLLPLLP